MRGTVKYGWASIHNDVYPDAHAQLKVGCLEQVAHVCPGMHFCTLLRDKVVIYAVLANERAPGETLALDRVPEEEGDLEVLAAVHGHGRTCCA